MVRIKHRYFLLNVLYPTPRKSTTSQSKLEDNVPLTIQFHRPSSDRFDSKLLGRMIRDGVSDLFGDYGAGMIAGSLQVKYLSTATSTAIVRVARAHYRMVWAALSFATKIPRPVDQACVIQVVRVSGTIKKCEEEAIRRARLAIVRAQRANSEGAIRAPSTGVVDGDSDWIMTNSIEDADTNDDTEDEGD